MSENLSKLNYETRDGIALITLNDLPANTYSYEMMQQLDRAILEARMDDAVQVIVITGAGEKFFCAGADIRMLADVTPSFKYYFCLHANETLSRLEQTPKLVIAGINAHCAGGGGRENPTSALPLFVPFNNQETQCVRVQFSLRSSCSSRRPLARDHWRHRTFRLSRASEHGTNR